MTIALDADRLKHALPGTFSVLLPLKRPLALHDVAAIYQVFERFGGGPATQADVDQQWMSLQERAGVPWEAIEPPFLEPPGRDPDWGLRLNRSSHSFDNISLRRRYKAIRCCDVEWLVDLFNPNDELGISYVGAGEPVVALLFRLLAPRNAQFPPSFFEVLAGVDAALSPAAVVGGRSVAGVMLAYVDGRLPLTQSPWRLLHPLTVVNRGDCRVPEAELAKTFGVVLPWTDDRLLLQLDPTFRSEFRPARTKAAARLVGRVSTDEVFEGRHPTDITGLPTATSDLWPTPVRDNDNAPTSIELVSSRNHGLVRQALYQVQAGDMLQTRGHRIRALQAPLVTDRIRLTIPIVVDREPQVDACVFTQCEPWTPAQIADLRQWIGDLRVASDAPVIIVANQHSATVAALPEVEEFLVHRYDNLPIAP